MIFTDTALTDKYGPLPVWGWVVIGGAGIGAVMWWRAHRAVPASSDASGYVDVGQIQYPQADASVSASPSPEAEHDPAPLVIPGVGIVTGPGQSFHPFPTTPSAPPKSGTDVAQPKVEAPPPRQPVTAGSIQERRLYQAQGDDSDVYYIDKGQKRITTGRPLPLGHTFDVVTRDLLDKLPLGAPIRVQDIG